MLNVSVKTSPTKELLGFDIEFCRKRVKVQMSPEMSGSKIHIDHVKSIASFDVSKDCDLREALN